MPKLLSKVNPMVDFASRIFRPQRSFAAQGEVLEGEVLRKHYAGNRAVDSEKIARSVLPIHLAQGLELPTASEKEVVVSIRWTLLKKDAIWKIFFPCVDSGPFFSGGYPVFRSTWNLSGNRRARKYPDAEKNPGIVGRFHRFRDLKGSLAWGNEERTGKASPSAISLDMAGQVT